MGHTSRAARWTSILTASATAIAGLSFAVAPQANAEPVSASAASSPVHSTPASDATASGDTITFTAPVSEADKQLTPEDITAIKAQTFPGTTDAVQAAVQQAIDDFVAAQPAIKIPATPDAPSRPVVFMTTADTAVVEWQEPHDNLSPITKYTATASPSGKTCAVTGDGVTPTASICTISGLQIGTTYTFTVVATNALGNSTPSRASVPLTVIGAPDAPGKPIAQVGDEPDQVKIRWTAPVKDNGSEIIHYNVESTPAGLRCETEETDCVLAGAVAERSYTFKVSATNAAGQGVASASSDSYTHVGMPGPVSEIKVFRIDDVATISWTAPTDDGGASIQGYLVESRPGNLTCVASAVERTCSVKGLQDGITYDFVVAAYNGHFISTASGGTAIVRPTAPQQVQATPGRRQLTITWQPPANDGGAPITKYVIRVTHSEDSAMYEAVGTSLTVDNLVGGTEYLVEVSAMNAAGPGVAGLGPAASTRATPLDVPSPPSNVQASADDASALVTWFAPLNDGGSPVTGYTVTSAPDGRTCQSNAELSCTVTGLTNGTKYKFSVTATNAQGTSEPSQQSVEVTPVAVVTPLTQIPPTPANVKVRPGRGSALVSWEASPNAAGVTYTVTSKPGDKTCTTTETSCTVDGLTDGVEYTFTVVASNDAGASTPTSPTPQITAGFERVSAKEKVALIKKKAWSLAKKGSKLTVKYKGKTYKAKANAKKIKVQGKKYAIRSQAQRFLADAGKSHPVTLMGKKASANVSGKTLKGSPKSFTVNGKELAVVTYKLVAVGPKALAKAIQRPTERPFQASDIDVTGACPTCGPGKTQAITNAATTAALTEPNGAAFAAAAEYKSLMAINALEAFMATDGKQIDGFFMGKNAQGDEVLRAFRAGTVSFDKEADPPTMTVQNDLHSVAQVADDLLKQAQTYDPTLRAAKSRVPSGNYTEAALFGVDLDHQDTAPLLWGTAGHTATASVDGDEITINVPDISTETIRRRPAVENSDTALDTVTMLDRWNSVKDSAVMTFSAVTPSNNKTATIEFTPTSIEKVDSGAKIVGTVPDGADLGDLTKGAVEPKLVLQTTKVGSPKQVVAIVGDSISSGEGGRWRASLPPNYSGNDKTDDYKSCRWGSDLSCRDSSGDPGTQKITHDPNFPAVTANPANTLTTMVNVRPIDNGKFYAFGSFQLGERLNLVRFKADGTVDDSFATPTLTGTSATNLTRGKAAEITAVTVQADGKVLIAGFFNAVDGHATTTMARLNADGTVDNTFTSGMPTLTSATNTPVSAIEVLSNGQIVVGGNFPAAAGTLNANLTLLNSDGSRDTGFTLPRNVGGNFGTSTSCPEAGPATDAQNCQQLNLTTNSSKVLSIADAGDGFLVGGQFSARIVKVNLDGSVDAGFKSPLSGISTTTMSTYKPVSDILKAGDKFLIGGGWADIGGKAAYGFLARINANGSLDPDFVWKGAKTGNFVNALQMVGDDLIVASATGVYRVKDDGDTSKQVVTTVGGANTTNGFGGVMGAAVQTDPKCDEDCYVAAGGFTSAQGSTALKTFVRWNYVELIPPPAASYDPLLAYEKSSRYVAGPTENGAGGMCNRSHTAAGTWLGSYLNATQGNVVTINLACSGAVAKNLALSQHGGVPFKGEKPQSEQLRELATFLDVNWVPMTIGANDIGFADMAIVCGFAGIGADIIAGFLAPGANPSKGGCRTKFEPVLPDKLSEARPMMETAMLDIRNAAPQAKITVGDYQSPIAPVTSRLAVDNDGNVKGDGNYDPALDPAENCPALHPTDYVAEVKCIRDTALSGPTNGHFGTYDGTDNQVRKVQELQGFPASTGTSEALIKAPGQAGEDGKKLWYPTNSAIARGVWPGCPLIYTDNKYANGVVVPSLNTNVETVVDTVNESLSDGQKLTFLSWRNSFKGREVCGQTTDGTAATLLGNQSPWLWPVGGQDPFAKQHRGVRASFFTGVTHAQGSGGGLQNNTIKVLAVGSNGMAPGIESKDLGDGVPGDTQESLHPNARGQMSEGLCLALHYGLGGPDAGTGNYCLREPGHTNPANPVDYEPDRLCLVASPAATSCKGKGVIDDPRDSTTLWDDARFHQVYGTDAVGGAWD